MRNEATGRRIEKSVLGFYNENGYSPSYREIGTAVGIGSTSTVHSQLRKQIVREDS